MHKNFDICPHCFAKGKDRVIRPATPHRTPLVSRSDGSSFHLFVEEAYVRRAPTGSDFEIVAPWPFGRFQQDTRAPLTSPRTLDGTARRLLVGRVRLRGSRQRSCRSSMLARPPEPQRRGRQAPVVRELLSAIQTDDASHGTRSRLRDSPWKRAVGVSTAER